MGMSVADELGFGGVAEQGLDHSECAQFGVGEFGCETDRWPLGCPLGMVDDEVVDGDVESCGEGVQVGFMPCSFTVQGLCKPPDRGHPRHSSGG